MHCGQSASDRGGMLMRRAALAIVLPASFHSVAPLQNTPGKATLSITFTPEPGLGLSELAGAAALLSVGAVKRARNRRGAETSTQG